MEELSWVGDDKGDRLIYWMAVNDFKAMGYFVEATETPDQWRASYGITRNDERRVEGLEAAKVFVEAMYATA